MPKDGQKLYDLVAEAVDRRHGAPRVRPSLIAQEVLDKLDAEQPSHRLVWIGCNLELRQIARGLLAAHFDPIKTTVDADPDLFENLQRRYPEAPEDGEKRSDDPSYVLRDLMSDDDVRWNVNRLRAEAQAKMAHADALEAWNANRKLSA